MILSASVIGWFGLIGAVAIFVAVLVVAVGALIGVDQRSPALTIGYFAALNALLGAIVLSLL